jgi:hypothetical protein
VTAVSPRTGVHRVPQGSIIQPPPHVLYERELRLAALSEMDAISSWLGDPIPSRSALAVKQREEAERAAAHPAISISAVPSSAIAAKAIATGQAAKLRAGKAAR